MFSVKVISSLDARANWPKMTNICFVCKQMELPQFVVNGFIAAYPYAGHFFEHSLSSKFL